MAVNSIKDILSKMWRFKDTMDKNSYMVSNWTIGINSHMKSDKKLYKYYYGNEVQESSVLYITQYSSLSLGGTDGDIYYFGSKSYKDNYGNKPRILIFNPEVTEEDITKFGWFGDDDEQEYFEMYFYKWWNGNVEEVTLQTVLEELGDSIRNVSGTTDPIALMSMGYNLDTAIQDYVKPEGTFPITDNGEYNIRTYDSVNVDIPKGTDTSDANATSSNLLLGKTAYVNGQKIEGSIETYDGTYSPAPDSPNQNNSSLTINGDVVTLTAGANITAGDFVEFLSEKYKVDEDLWDSIYGVPSCVAIDDNRVFIAHKDGNSGLYGSIVKLTDDGEITFHSHIIGSECFTDPIATLIDTNKVLIVAGSRGEFRCIYLVEINETTATLKATNYNSDTGHNNWGRNIVTITPNKAFFAHEYNNDMDMDYMVFSGLAGTVVEVNGNIISEYNTVLDDMSESCLNQPYCITLEDNKVFIAISNGADRELYGRIYEINDTTPQYVVSSRIQDWDYCRVDTQVATKLNDNKLFIAYVSEYQENVLVSEIINIDGTTINHSTMQLTNGMESANRVYSCEVISSDDDKEIYEVLVTYSKNDSLQCMKVKVNQYGIIEKTTPIKLQITKQYECNETSSVKLGDNVFLAHYAYDNDNSISLVGATIYGNPTAILSKDTIDGIAKTSGNIGEEIEVYIPKED